MAEPLKNMFNKKFYQQLAEEFKKADKNFNSDKFVTEVIKGIDELSLNQRLRNTSVVLRKYLPEDYKKTVPILYKVVPTFQSHYNSFLFPDFVGLYGHDNYDLTIEA